MPTTLTTDTEKTKVRKAVPTSKILIAAVARLYIASPNPNQWSYTHKWGAAALLKDAKKNNSYFIRLINIEHSAGAVVWEQELYVGFQFNKDAPFFYSFDTDEYLAGLEFVDEEEGEIFYRKLQRRGAGSSNKTEMKKPSGAAHFLRSSLGRKSKISKYSIGNPKDFTHLAHVGYEPEKGFSLNGKNSDLVKDLQALGISESEIEQNQDFILDYLKQHGSRPSSVASNSKSVEGKRPPPPPPSRRIHMPSHSTNDTSSSTHPPQSQNNNSHCLTSGRPPPPPLPPRYPNQGSPLSPAHHLLSSSVPKDDGRTDLMASIRETGGFGALKQGRMLRVVSEESGNYSATSTEAATPTATPSSEDNLAASLANVLHQRKMAMESDEDTEDDDWD